MSPLYLHGTGTLRVCNWPSGLGRGRGRASSLLRALLNLGKQAITMIGEPQNLEKQATTLSIIAQKTASGPEAASEPLTTMLSFLWQSLRALWLVCQDSAPPPPPPHAKLWLIGGGARTLDTAMAYAERLTPGEGPRVLGCLTCRRLLAGSPTRAAACLRPPGPSAPFRDPRR